MKWALPGRVPLRLRFFFRAAFALLAAATLGLALNVLQDEKQRGHRVYAESLRQNQAQIAARLRHPTGQLMLLNPGLAERASTPVAPVVLPFGALDFDDRTKAQQAVEMAGCALQYPDGSTLCAAVGSNPYAGGFLYLVGSFASGELVEHLKGDLDFSHAHRMAIEVALGGRRWRWIAPYEGGRLTGYDADLPIVNGTRFVRDFRGWLWQEARCLPDAAQGDGCLRRSFFSVRLPVELFRELIAARPLVWPPAELAQASVEVQVLAPGDGAPLFDSRTPGATLPFSLAELQPLLLPGETLTVRREGGAQPLLQLKGQSATQDSASPWIDALIRRLPVEGDDTPLESTTGRSRVDSAPAGGLVQSDRSGGPFVAKETIATPLGRYEIALAGDLRSVNRQLAAVATRLSGFVGAMLAAVLLTWLAIEIAIIRRVTLLTRRAAAVSTGMSSGGGLPALDVRDIGGGDELGVLAQGLRDLLARVNDDVRREQIRAEQEKNLWHAVGHEIMSPLQSLMALHGTAGDPAERYISRMQQAIRVLYGQASPSEAFASTTLAPQAIDIDAFLGQLAANAHYIGIEGIVYAPLGQPLVVRADEYSLEDVLTHVLRNAERYRVRGSAIRIGLHADQGEATVSVYNRGPAIPDELLARIFEYGVSDTPEGTGHRGQGLFVAKTYMAKMNGTIAARNADDGVEFVLTLPRMAAAP